VLQQQHEIASRYEVAVIGGGPAGLSAALVLGRCLRRTLVCDSGNYRNQQAQALHCFLGHDGVAPAELRDVARSQLQQYQTVTCRNVLVTAVDRAGDEFLLSFKDRRTSRARMVLFASGVVDELPAVAGIEALFGRSVHVCPYCDGWQHRGAPIAVFGRGEKGAGLALLLRQWTHDLILCTHGPTELAAAERRALDHYGIPVREEPIAKLEATDGCLEAVVFQNGARLARKALFFSTGQHPRSRLLESLGCQFAEKGVVYDEDGATSVHGIYVAGDVSRDVQLAVIAAAEGARAALAINKGLLHRDHLLA
jgi:thioredoxin reductase